MKRYLSAIVLVAAGAIAGVGLDRGIQSAVAQAAPPEGLKRAILQRIDVPDSAYEVVIGTAEIAPGVASIGRHKHAGVEAGVATEGQSTLTIEGQGDVVLKPGDSYRIEAGVPHDVSSGAAGGKVIAVYVVEKGKPLATPAPNTVAK
jgi:quercetin dioxygenase-like cupin family protein